MSSAAQELIQAVEANGGRLVIEGDYLVVYPSEAGEPLVEELRLHKPAIIHLLLTRAATPDEAAIGWALWLLERCIYRDRWWGGVGCLYLDLAGWLAERGRPVPVSRLAFEKELQAEGFQITPDGLVYGLILKADLEADARFQTVPNTPKSAVSARPTTRKHHNTEGKGK